MPLLVVAGMAGCAGPGEMRVDRLDQPFAAAGDVQRGREVFVSRAAGHCVICHAAPGIAVAGDVGPPLSGIGSRLSTGQLRIRVADITRVKPDAAMPAFHRAEGLARVAPSYADQPILDGQQLEDVVAYLASLK